MRRMIPIGISGLLGVAFVAAPVAAQDEQLDRIDMPPGWAPEGITTDGDRLFAGSLANGAIWQVDPAVGEGSVLVEGSEGMVVAGLDHGPGGRLWAAGAPTGEVRAYDAASGELLATYPVQGGFLNDVAATDEAVYVTDSFMPQVVVIPLSEDGALPEPDAVELLPVTGQEYVEGFNLNGIVATDAGLVAVHSAKGELWRIDSATGEASVIDTGEVDLTAGDGLELVGDTLYVVRNQLNQIVALQLDEAAESASLIGEITSEDFDVPTTVAQLGDDLWAVNARFGTEVMPETEYWMTRVDAIGESMDDEAAMDEDATMDDEAATEGE